MRKKSLLKYTLLNQIRAKLVLNSFCRKWSKNNPDNDIIPNNIFPIDVCRVGKYSYGELNIVTFDCKSKLIIGNYVSIAQNVYFLLDVEHYTNHISTYPFRAKILLESAPETFSKGDIVIEDDVWIGFGAIIMSGIRIGQGAVIAAGAVVTKDVPAYAIVGGSPARIIKFRFDEPICEKLSEMEFSSLSEEQINYSINTLYEQVTLRNVDDVLNELINSSD